MRSIIASFVSLVFFTTPVIAQQTTLEVIKQDDTLQQSLIAAGLLTSSYLQVRDGELITALRRFRTIYQAGRKIAPNAELKRMRSINNEFTSLSGLTKIDIEKKHKLLIPRKLVTKHKSKNKNDSFLMWRQRGSCCIFMKFNFSNNTTIVPQQSFLRALKRSRQDGTILSIQTSNRGYFLHRVEKATHSKKGEYVLHRFGQVYRDGIYAVTADVGFSELPIREFIVPSFIEPQISYWRNFIDKIKTADPNTREKKSLPGHGKLDLPVYMPPSLSSYTHPIPAIKSS